MGDRLSGVDEVAVELLPDGVCYPFPDGRVGEACAGLSESLRIGWELSDVVSLVWSGWH